MPEGAADTTTDFIFSERIETIRDDSKKDTPHVPLERLLHQIGSSAAADGANMFLVPTKMAHHIWQKRFRTNSINNMRRERMQFLMFSHETAIPTFMSWSVIGLSCHVLSAHNMLYGVHRPACFLEA